MGSSYDPTSLAPVITFPTQAPFPKITFVKEDGSDEAVPRTISDDKEKVHVHLCSEFLQHVLPATAFQASRQLGFVLDAAGQPMVVSIGADKVRFISLIMYALHGFLSDLYQAPLPAVPRGRGPWRLAVDGCYSSQCRVWGGRIWPGQLWGQDVHLGRFATGYRRPLAPLLSHRPAQLPLQ